MSNSASSNPLPPTNKSSADDDNLTTAAANVEENIVEKLTKSGWYVLYDTDMIEKSLDCDKWLHRYNQSLGSSLDVREALLHERIGHVGQGARVKPPFFCLMGFNIHLAAGVFINFNGHFLDTAKIEIGENTLLGPGVRIITPDHHRDPQLRAAGWERSLPVQIGRNCWIGTGATILPGITIGDNCIVGANSVVTKDVPSNSTVVGSPARQISKKENDANNDD